MLRRSRLLSSPHPPPLSSTPTAPRYFSNTPFLYDDSFPDHYATLGVSPTATAAEIKKQFYALSKQHHPDLNPSPQASTRFVAISDAYHALGSAESRARYDRDYARHHPSQRHQHQQHPHHHGSYSSAAGPAGSRPASGLSRRRTQFRGPPPSFYRSGGWGAQGAKRERYAYTGQSEPPPPGEDAAGSSSWASGARSSSSGSSSGGGYGPGQGEERFDPDIPYWNRAAHRRTQDGLEGRAIGAAARRAQRDRGSYDEAGEKGIWVQFVLVSSAIVVGVVVVPALMWSGVK